MKGNTEHNLHICLFAVAIFALYLRLLCLLGTGTGLVLICFVCGMFNQFIV